MYQMGKTYTPSQLKKAIECCILQHFTNRILPKFEAFKIHHNGMFVPLQLTLVQGKVFLKYSNNC